MRSWDSLRAIPISADIRRVSIRVRSSDGVSGEDGFLGRMERGLGAWDMEWLLFGFGGLLGFAPGLDFRSRLPAEADFLR